MSTADHRKREATPLGPTSGVTLIEVLIAITLLSMLSVGMMVAMRIGLSAFAKTDSKLMDNRRVAGAQRLVEQELKGMMPVAAPCGQIGVITKTPDSGAMIGPPAESEYAVEPVGVATIKPSALNSVNGSPFTRVRKRTSLGNSPRLKTASFNPIMDALSTVSFLTRTSRRVR